MYLFHLFRDRDHDHDHDCHVLYHLGLFLCLYLVHLCHLDFPCVFEHCYLLFLYFEVYNHLFVDLILHQMILMVHLIVVLIQIVRLVVFFDFLNFYHFYHHYHHCYVIHVKHLTVNFVIDVIDSLINYLLFSFSLVIFFFLGKVYLINEILMVNGILIHYHHRHHHH